MIRKMKRLRGDAKLFVREVLGVEPDLWQEQVLESLTSKRIAIRSGHGVGKTALESWAALHFLFTNPQAKVVVTAPTMHQLLDVFMSEVSKWLKRSALLSDLFEATKTRIVCKGSPEWFLVARTASTPESLAGFHADNLLFILDEASGIDDALFEVVEGSLTGRNNKILMCSNPTRTSGFFKRAFFEEREMYRTFKVSSLESDRVSDDYSKRLIKAYGEDSDVVRVRVLGEFPKAEGDGVIPLELVEAAMSREPTYEGELVIGVDVARFGDDSTVVATRIGKSVLPLKSWVKVDLMTTCGRIVQEVRRVMQVFKKKEVVINVDETGVGGGVVDRLKEVFGRMARVSGFNNGSKARNEHYKNFGAESWFALRERFQSGEITLPRDELLAAELSTRKYDLTSDGRLMLEQKSEYKKRIGRSPDRADALVLAFCPSREYGLPEMPLVQSYWRAI